MDGILALDSIIKSVMKDISEKGLDLLGRTPAGDYAIFRGIELSAAINRLRTLAVK
jgi:hypothetical protein